MIDDARTLATQLTSELAHKTHIVALCGKNAGLRTSIQRIADRATNDRVVLHSVGMKDADAISTLMHRGSVILTKPGGSTVNEALAAKLPMLFRGGIGTLPWEQGNSEFCAANKLGEWTQGGSELVGRIEKALAETTPASIDDCPARSFGPNLKRVIDDMIARKEAADEAKARH